MKKFVFIVHPLSVIHQKILGFRVRKWDVIRPNNILHPKNISTVASFSWYRNGIKEIVGEVVAIPMLPEQMIQQPAVAIERMIRAINYAARDGIFPHAVGLGSLCAVVAGRGQELQQKIPVPVTTGNAGTAWCMFQNAKNLHQQYGHEVGIIGANSPVGTAVVQLFHRENIVVYCDSRKGAKGTNAIVQSTEEVAQKAKIIVGCSSTGPILDSTHVQPDTHLVDVAIPSSIQGKIPKNIQVYAGESMSFSSNWKRGTWGPFYHLVSGYGLQSVLACMIEPVVLVQSKRQKPFAQGRKLHVDDVLQFGHVAQTMGFVPKIRNEFAFL